MLNPLTVIGGNTMDLFYDSKLIITEAPTIRTPLRFSAPTFCPATTCCYRRTRRAQWWVGVSLVIAQVTWDQ